MAKITLGIIGDTSDVYKKIATLQADVAKIKPVQVKFDVQGDAKLMNAFARANNAAANYQKELRLANAEEKKARQSAKQTAEAINYLNTTAAKYDAQIKASAVSAKRFAASLESQIKAEKDARKTTEGLASSYNVIDQAIHARESSARSFSQALRQQMREEQENAKAAKNSATATRELGDEQNKTTTSTINFGNAFTKVWSRIVSTLSRRLINQAFTALRSNIQETLTTMKAVDTQLINIQKVSGKTSQEIAAIGERAYDTAAKYGVAVDDYLSAVYSFQKAGLGESAEDLAELATKTMLVGDTTSAIAEKFLISSNAAWELHGNIAELNKVIDEADYINNNYATTLDKIAAGLPIVASVAANAGMSYSETMAALGTIQSITQESGTKSATALRALILNIEKEAGSYLTEDGEEFEVTEESIKGLQGLLEKYAKAEMDAARASGELINPMTAIKALFEGMRNQDLNENELFQLLSAMGGKLRTNQLTALVKNFDMFDEMLVQLGDSAGTADKEIGLMMESWAKKTQVLKDRWMQFIAGLVSTDEIKGLVDNLTEFVTNLDPEKIGGAIRDFLQPLIEFIRNTDWAGAAQHLSEIFDKIMNAAKIGGIAIALSGILSVVQKIIPLFKSGGILSGVTSFFSLLISEGPAALALIGPTGGFVLGIAAITGAVIALSAAIDTGVEKYEKAEKAVSDLKNEYEKLYGAGSEYDRLKNSEEELTDIEKKRLDILEAQKTALDGQIKAAEKEAAARWNAVYGSGATAYINEYDENGARVGGHSGTQDKADLVEIRHSAEMARAEYGATGDVEKYRSELLGLVDAYAEVYNQLIKMREAEIPLTESQNSLINYYEQLATAASASAEEIKKAQSGGDKVTNFFNKKSRANDSFWGVDIAKETAKWEAYTEAVEAANEAVRTQAEERQSAFGLGFSPSLLEDMQQPAEDAGKGVGEGLAQGIEESTGDATGAAEEMANAVELKYREVLQVHSPSRVTQEIGKGVGEGLAKGMQSTIGTIQSAAASAARAIGTGIISQSGFIQSQISRIVGMAREFVSGLMSSAAMSYHWGNGNWVDRNGNFHSGANGIPARAGGDSNFPGGKTLVNELGPELISENGRAYIAGGGKPTVVDLAPGAIVIPADQTREALKGGMPKYGRAKIATIGQSGWGGEILTTSPAKVSLASRILGSEAVNSIVGIAQDAWNKLSGSGGGGGGGGGSGRGGGGGSSAPTKQDFDSLESALSDLLSKLDEQIKLAENEGDYPRVVELYEQAQEAISDLVEKYRKAGYADDSIEILQLLNKNYDYANKQLDVYHDKWDELINALSADTDATKAAKELEEKRLALEEAQAAYENAQKQRTVRMYNAATGQWEWIADDKKVQSAREAVTSAEDSYTDAVKSQAIAELEKMKDTVSDLSDVVLGPALSTVVTMAETTEEFQNFARALNAVFGVGSFLQSTEGSTKVQPTVDSHDTNYTFGGVDITPEQAANMSLKELAQMLQVLKIT